MPEQTSIEQLYQRYLANDLNEEELQDFLLRLHNNRDEEKIKLLMDDTWNEMFQASLNEHTPVIPLYKRKIFKYIAAASIILIAAVGYLVISNQWGTKSGTIGEKSPSTADVQAPTNTRAVITLANGSKVYLDSAGNGVLAQESNVAVVRNEKGEIIYNRKDAETPGTQGEIAYNTLFNPRGSKVISLTLSDGTKVWLNSESSLRYPASFAPSAVNREVEITGEAYFEVKHNSKQPFKVHLPNGSIVEDIGTAFNINSYSDEVSIKTTLIEGAVRITAANAATAAVKIKPGEQSVISRTSPDHYITTSPDIDEVLAWKNNLFSFQSADIKTIMRQIARWYDLDVVYEGTPPTKQITGEAPRDISLQTLLKILALSDVKLRLEGKKIYVQ